MLRIACVTAIVVGVASFGATAAYAWSPEAATYGTGERTNVPVTMSDGTVLRANVFYPTDPKTGQPAPGPFPVLMVQNPYGKDTVGSASGAEGGAEAGTQTGAIPYLIQRGYIDVVAEVRGTGDSGGTFDLLNPIQARDGAELVRWAARLPNSNGRVGLYGPSYMGIDQYMTANALGPGSPLKAMFPIVAGNDTYRDIAFDGGLLDAEFDITATASVFGGLELINPAAENPTDIQDLLQVESQHVPALANYNLAQIVNISTGGDQAYDEAYWQTRAPRNMLARVVANGIPVFAVGGWYDLYQRGTPLNYSGLQDAWDGRAVGEPMLPGQAVTGRYQLLQGPWYHLDAGTGFDIYRIELAWFDRWLKDEQTGVDNTTTPLHLYMLGADRWVDVSRYPLDQARPHTYYLAGGPSRSGALSINDGRLADSAPARSGADPIAYVGVSSPCDRSTEQWGAGGGALALELGQLPPDPCAADDRSLEVGPGALTYTTDAMAQDTVVAGPIDATIFASSTRPDVALIATLEDVAPDGRPTPISSGALLGSFRAIDSRQSWYAPDGRPLLPYHPYTQSSVAAVPVGQVTRFDVELFPTFALLRRGDRLRLTLTTSDSPHLLPSAAQAATLAGGVYEVQRGGASASFLEIPLAPLGALSGAGSELASRVAAPVRARCTSSRRLRVVLHAPRGGRWARIAVYVGKRLVRLLPRPGARATIDLRRLVPRGRHTVRIVATTRRGRRIVRTRHYRVC